MNRAERLLHLADLLRAAEATTVEAMAGTLDVNRRTVLRDLAALRERGLPITGESGPGGGIRLEGGRGVTAVHLSVSEVVALWLAARLAREASDLPWGEAAQSGMAKLLGSVPNAKGRSLRALCRRVIVGPPASVAVRQSAGVTPRELLRLFEEAFSGGVGLGFHYRDAGDRTSIRRAEPHGLLVQPPVWYVLARDLDKCVPRTFRMDRISRPQVLHDITFRPDPAVIQAQLPDLAAWRPLTGNWV